MGNCFDSPTTSSDTPMEQVYISQPIPHVDIADIRVEDYRGVFALRKDPNERISLGSQKSISDPIVVIMFCDSTSENFQELSDNFWYLSQEFKGDMVQFLTADTVVNKEKASTLNVTYIPSYLLFITQIEIDRYEGSDMEVLKTKIKYNLEETFAGESGKATICTTDKSNK